MVPNFFSDGAHHAPGSFRRFSIFLLSSSSELCLSRIFGEFFNFIPWFLPLTKYILIYSCVPFKSIKINWMLPSWTLIKFYTDSTLGMKTSHICSASLSTIPAASNTACQNLDKEKTTTHFYFLIVLLLWFTLWHWWNVWVNTCLLHLKKSKVG